MANGGGFLELSRTVRDDEFGMPVGEVRIRAPDGAILRRRYLHTPGAVAVVAIDGSDLVLVREYRAAVGESVLAVPMGKIPDDVEPHEQAVTELAEETGLVSASCAPIARLLSCPGWMNQILHVFVATRLVPAGRPEFPDIDDIEEQHSDVVRIPWLQVDEAIADGLIRDARTISALCLVRMTGRGTL